MNTSLDPSVIDLLSKQLREANLAFARTHPGEGAGRQPVHTVYGGAQLFRSDTAPRIGALALAALREFAPDPDSLAAAIGLSPALATEVHERVVAKLEAEPVEDFRIDFEDGYGNRPDSEEDAHAKHTANEVAAGLRNGTLPGSIGIRIKTLNEELRRRAIRTLDLFLTTLVKETGGELPANFVVTLPKITVPQQVSHLVGVLEQLESALGLAAGAVRFELMIETPQSLIAQDGRVALPLLLQEGRGRISAAHFGTYDFTAALNVTAAHQTMSHPLCLFARELMQVSLAGTGIWLSDGSTAVLPVPPHRGDTTAAQRRENTETMHRAWRMHHDDVSESLRLGLYQGWDLHPAQLVTRYAAIYAFFLAGLDAAGARLRNFMDRAAQATLLGQVFDDAATGQGLLNFFLRAINCGAIAEDEVAGRTGLTLEELRTRSFVGILRGRTG
ncbi:MAG: phosphoenolpyruvate kinase [Gemmatimonadota bacterium]